MASGCARLRCVSVTTRTLIDIIGTHISLKRNNSFSFILGFREVTNVNKHAYAFGQGKNRMIGRWLWLAGYRR